MKNILSFGEIVWDVFKDSMTLGGAPLNFAYFCKKFGENSAIISAVGRDDMGMAALETMMARGISAKCVSSNSRPTGKVNVSFSDDGEPKYEIVADSAWDFIELEPAAEEFAKNADAFAFGTLAQRTPTSREALEKALSLCPVSCLKVFDANLRQNFHTKEIIYHSFGEADIVKLNESELFEISSSFNYGGDFRSRAKFLFDAFDLQYLVVTKGGEGYEIFGRGGDFSGKAEDVDVVDTVGAGDAFISSFTCGLLNGKSASESAAYAAKVSANVCQKRGAMCLG